MKGFCEKCGDRCPPVTTSLGVSPGNDSDSLLVTRYRNDGLEWQCPECGHWNLDRDHLIRDLAEEIGGIVTDNLEPETVAEKVEEVLSEHNFQVEDDQGQKIISSIRDRYGEIRGPQAERRALGQESPGRSFWDDSEAIWNTIEDILDSVGIDSPDWGKQETWGGFRNMLQDSS